MGLFNLFKRKAAAPAPATPNAAAPPSLDGRRPALPTVKPGRELFDAYATAFREEVGKLRLLSRKDMDAALALVTDGDGGFLSQGRYHRDLFERYFRDTDWRWPEFEERHAIGARLGRRPAEWEHAGVMSYADARAIGPEAIANYRWSTYGLLMRHILGQARSAGQRARLAKLGIRYSVWCHSNGGNTMRPSHVKASQEKQFYSVERGWYDPDEGQRIWPGSLVGCKCFSRPILPFMEADYADQIAAIDK